MTDLSQKMTDASQSDDSDKASALKSILSKIGGGSEKVDETEDLQQKSKAYNFNPDDVAPPEVQQQLFSVLKWRDSVYREILKKIEMIPGLSDLIDELTNALNAYVYTVIAPWITVIKFLPLVVEFIF